MEELLFRNARSGFDFTEFSSRLDRFFSENHIPLAKQLSVELIVEELVTNILKYGGSADPEITVDLSYDCGSNKLELEIRDDTHPFDPTSAGPADTESSVEERQVGGLGIYLVREKSSSMVYEYRDHFNIIRLTVQE